MDAFLALLANTVVLQTTAVVLLVMAVLVSSYSAVANPQSLVMLLWARYCVALERKLRLMFIWTPGYAVAAGQIVGFVLVLLGYVLIDLPGWYLWIALIAVVPPYQIERMRQRRVEAIEAQLDGFLMALANALKSTPSIANGFVSVQHLIASPLKEEIELANKEMRVGSTLDQALLNMAGRVGSRQLDSALSAILIGRQIGGDLPLILETTSATLREMARLEGVVKTKTAEGKAQMIVLAVFPFIMIVALNSMSEGYFDPLGDSVVGWVVAAAAGIFWLSSMVVARKVLSVDV